VGGAGSIEPQGVDEGREGGEAEDPGEEFEAEEVGERVKESEDEDEGDGVGFVADGGKEVEVEVEEGEGGEMMDARRAATIRAHVGTLLRDLRYEIDARYARVAEAADETDQLLGRAVAAEKEVEALLAR